MVDELIFLLPSLPGLCYFMKEIVSRTDVALADELIG
jgi:hypothetical protein